MLRGLPSEPEVSRPAEPPRAVRQLVVAAIAADRFDLFLQRVVGLPQRRVRGYEVTLRPDGSDVLIPNSEIRQAVEAVGHQLSFDRKLMIQTIRLARVFERRERDVMLFVDVSHRFLMSEDAFDDINALVADAPLAPQRIVLSLPQRFFAKAVATEHEALRRLSELGFRFLLRDVETFEFDLSRLSRIGVRWIRASAGALLEAVETRDQIMEVAVADFVALLDRRKIAFIAESVGEEATVAELLDLGVAYASGAVFAPPQAVRADVLESEMASSAAPAPAARPVEPGPERRGLRDIARRA
jgi:cyclic-di-GMP phosphodiesterase TipF (flagellum assembly factor)